MIAAEDPHASDGGGHPGPAIPAPGHPPRVVLRRAPMTPAWWVAAGALVCGLGIMILNTPARAQAPHTTAPQANDATVAEETSGTSADGTGTPSTDPAGSADEPEAPSWPERVSLLRRGLETGEMTPADADRLYAELSSTLWPLVSQLRRAIDADDPELVELHARLTLLHAQRSELFALISPALREELTDVDRLGRDELRREAAYLSARLDYQRRILGSTIQHLSISITEAPWATLRNLFWFFVAILVFRWWRRWARGSIPAWRKSLLAARPDAARTCGLRSCSGTSSVYAGRSSGWPCSGCSPCSPGPPASKRSRPSSPRA